MLVQVVANESAAASSASASFADHCQHAQKVHQEQVVLVGLEEGVDAAGPNRRPSSPRARSRQAEEVVAHDQ